MAQKNYFSHDYGARVKLSAMRRKCGLEGVGFYWCFVEMLHEEGGTIKESLVEGIAYDLHIEPEKAMSVIKDFGLFTVRKGKITCDRVDSNLAKKAAVSQARREAAGQRWNGVPEETSNLPTRAEKNETDGKEREIRQQKPMSEEEKERVEYFKGVIDSHFDEWQHVDDIDLYDDSIEPIRRLIDNIIDEVARKRIVKIDGAEVTADVFVGTLLYYFRNDEKRQQLSAAVDDVNQKVACGRVKNKECYLISALYKIAKMGGE